MSLRRFYSPLFTVGMVFLFNPVVGLVDLLPDFAGAFLIAASMTEIAMLDSRLEQARRLIYYVAGISAVRSVLMFFMFDMDESAMLSSVFLLGVAELFALIYFAVSFFGGIAYIAQRSESDNVLGDVDRIRRLWIIFCIVHTAASVLPELTALPQLTARVNPESLTWATERQIVLYRNYARLLFGTVSFIMAVWWFKNTYAFMKGVREDERFKESLSARYGSFIEANPLQNVFWDMRFALIAFTAGCALLLNFTVDGMAVLPAWLGSLFLLAAALRLDRKNKKAPIIFGGIILLQVLCIHVLSRYAVGTAVLSALSAIAVYYGETVITAHVKKAIDWEIDAYFYLTRLLYGAFFILCAVYSFIPNYWVHLARVICFILWMGTNLWVSSSVLGEIKLRRRL